MSDNESDGHSTDDNFSQNRGTMNNKGSILSSNDGQQNDIPEAIETDQSSINSNVSELVDGFMI